MGLVLGSQCQRIGRNRRCLSVGRSAGQALGAAGQYQPLFQQYVQTRLHIRFIDITNRPWRGVDKTDDVTAPDQFAR